jgi:riboflavin transporter FmnP
MLAIHIKVGFLTMDVKDTVITLCGLYFGPAASLIVSVLVPLLEYITISDTREYGLIMNILGSVSFSVTAALIYKWKKTFAGAITALVTAAFAMTGVMLLANLFITPYYMGAPREEVKAMIPTLLLPFNAIKAVLNVGLVLLLYKHIGNALRKAGFLPRKSFSQLQTQEQGAVVVKPSRWRIIGVSAVAVVLITGSLLIIFLLLGGSVGFGK